jgi:hypothetical protein
LRRDSRTRGSFCARIGEADATGFAQSHTLRLKEPMSGRRRYERFQPAHAWDGHVRVLHDVIVQMEPGGQLVAFGHWPGVVGEVLRLDLSGGGRTLSLDVRIGESRPVIVEGAVRHRLSFDNVARVAGSDLSSMGVRR